MCARVHSTSVEFQVDESAREGVQRRAAVMSVLRRSASPVFGRLGIRPLPLSTLWAIGGTLAARRELRAHAYDAIVATSPPVVALVVTRLTISGSNTPLVVELRDLWASNPAYDAGGQALMRLERWVLGRAQAIVACTPEAAADLRARHPGVAGRVHMISNGFERRLLAKARTGAPAPGRQIQILHSGTLTMHRPLTPLLRVLQREPYRARFRLVLHGYVVPETAREAQAAAAHCSVAVLPPSGWEQAVERIAATDVALITQAASAGDATAVASKVYEYLALGKPVLCLTDGGATESLLRRLGAERYCARLDDEAGIAAALERLLTAPWPEAIHEEQLIPYQRERQAKQMAALLDEVAGIRR